MKINKTPCCALRGLHEVYDNTPQEDIEEKLYQIAQTPLSGTLSIKPTTVQVVTIPEETYLRKTLKKIGFRQVATFRRAPNMGGGRLRLHFIDLKKIVEKFEGVKQ